MKSRIDELLPTLSGKKIEIPRYRSPGHRTAQMNYFLACARSGQSIEYHFPDYVMMSRKRYDELTHPLQTLPKIIRDEILDGGDICPAHSDGLHNFGRSSDPSATGRCVCGAKFNDTGAPAPANPRAPGPEVGV